ncbi:MAG: universal stress protein [Bryobacterales bacterium]|nr:universal stress protein [Bryobacterales bacterium]
MARFKKILVPVDLSARSLGLMNYARKLAEEFDSELLFLHAIQPQTWPLREPERETRDAIMEVLRTTRGRLLMREGLPAATILEVARSEPADGILMVTRGAKTFSMKFAGSITAQVLREAGCPVWAAAENFSLFARRPIRNILCALSLGPRTGPVLRWAAGLARRFDATLSVVHASRALESTLAHPADQEWRIWSGKWRRRTSSRCKPRSEPKRTSGWKPDGPCARSQPWPNRFDPTCWRLGRARRCDCCQASAPCPTTWFAGRPVRSPAYSGTLRDGVS